MRGLLKATGSFSGQTRINGGFCGNACGGIAVSFAMSLPVLFGAAGVAADFAMFNLKQSHLQAAADAAAIAGAKELALSNASENSITSVATSFVENALLESGSVASTQVAVEDSEGAVRVTVTENWTPFFAHFLGATITPIVSGAKATLSGQSSICVLALASSGAFAIRMDKTAKLLATSCAVYSNSTDAQGIRLDEDSEITAGLVCSVGGVKSKSTAIDPLPTTDCPAIDDPLAARVAPAVGTCDFDKIAINSGKTTLTPGRYCHGLTISGTAVVTFAEGDYVISGGSFRVTNTASIVGEHVAFYLDGSKATVDFSQQSTISLTGAKDGPMAGLLFFEDRNVPLDRQHRINSANAHTLTGTIYLSRGRLRIDPNTSVAQNSAYTAIVAHMIEIDEGPQLVMNSDYGATDVPVPDGIKASAQVVLAE